MKKIGILTTFYNYNPAFSLTTVVDQQIRMLLKYGYEPVLFVLDNFTDDDKLPAGTEIRHVLPKLILEPYGERKLDNLEADVKLAQKAMEENMQDIDVCLTHDIIFINSYLPYNIAMRNAIDTKLGNIKWLHWMHSGPSSRTIDGSPWDNLYTLPKNSRLIYMNYTGALGAAEMYGVLPKDVRTIFNPMDIRELYDFDPLTKRIIDAYDLMSADMICVYPLSTTRMGGAGKQLDKVIAIVGHLKKRGLDVRLVVPNAHANAEREKLAIEGMYQIAANNGLERREVVFTSKFEEPEWENGVPHNVVRDLFTLGNLFIFPSVSENCPLILLEAMAGKNILVLNQDFAPMRDFGQENAMYFKFGALGHSVEYNSGEDRYMADVALLIESEFNQNKALLANTNLRKKFNIDWIFKHQFEPAMKELCQN